MTNKFENFKKALWSSVKEGLRIAFFAAITAVLGWLGEKVGGLDPNSIYFIVGTLVLKMFDKFIHKNKNIAANGLAPF